MKNRIAPSGPRPVPLYLLAVLLALAMTAATPRVFANESATGGLLVGAGAEDPPETDWGVTLDAASSVRTAGHLDTDTWGRSVRGSVWGRRYTRLGEESSLDISAQGSYLWSRSLVFVTLDQGRVRARFPGTVTTDSVLDIRAGRFFFQDFTGQIFSHTADGVSAELGFATTTIHTSVAYTGLQINPTSRVRMTPDDVREEESDTGTFGPARMVAITGASFSDLPGRLRLDISLAGQIDGRDPEAGEATVNSGYILVGLGGPLVRNVYHDLHAAYTAGNVSVKGGKDSSYTGVMAGGRLRLFVPNVWNMRISARGAYAGPGFGDPENDTFIPISRQSASAVIPLPLQNLILGELDWSVRPLRHVQLRAAGRVFLLATDEQPLSIHEGFAPDPAGAITGPIGAPFGTKPEGTTIGYEVEGGFTYRMRSDLGIGVSTALFIPETGGNGVFTSDRKREFTGRIELSMRM